MKRVFFTVVGALALAGCSSMSGYDAKSEFSCKAPDGILCESMTGIYTNAQQRNLPGQRVTHRSERASEASDSELSHAKESNDGVLTRPIYSGTPIRSAPRVLRIWFAPWEDSDGDLHDQSYVYLPVDAGRWLIEHNRRRIQDTYRPVRAPAFQETKRTTNSASNTGNTDGMVTNGVMQQRPTPEQAAQLLGGLRQPSDVIPEK